MSPGLAWLAALLGLTALVMAALRVPVGAAIAVTAGAAVAALGGEGALAEHLQSGLWQRLQQDNTLSWACLAIGLGVGLGSGLGSGLGRRDGGDRGVPSAAHRALPALKRRLLRSAEWAGALFLLLLAAEMAFEAGRWLSQRA